MRTTHSIAFENTREDGFTLTDLLVVMATIGILGVLLLPAIAGTKPDTQAFQCLENLRQLTLAWQMYAEDNNGKLVPNGQQSTQAPQPTDTRYLPGGTWAQWCPGTVNAFQISATNFIKAGLIWPYIKRLDAYKCPADTKVFKFFGTTQSQPRSYSMNCCLSPIPPALRWNDPVTLRLFYKDTDFTQPGPSMTFVLIDENESTIGDTLFCCGPTDPNQWQNAPATRHGGCGTISYADGHVEMKRWTDQYLLMVPTIFSYGMGHASDSNSGDNAWLEQRVTVLK